MSDGRNGASIRRIGNVKPVMIDIPSLQTQLDHTRDAAFSQMPEGVKTVRARAMAKLKGSGLASNAIQTGDTTPDFTPDTGTYENHG